MRQSSEDTSTGPKRSRPLRWVPLAVVAIVAALVTAVPAAGAQADTANIRLAHLSPDTPEMDVYVAAAAGDEQRVLEGLGYGQVSDYAALPAGSYTFLLRPMGAPADSTPAVTASADLAAGDAYTFAAMGPHAELQKALLTDDLAPPPAGQAKVRLIQASSTAGEVDSRVMTVLVALATDDPLEVVGFPADPAEIDAGVPRRVVELRFGSRDEARAAGTVLEAQQAPYRPADIEIDPDGQVTVTYVPAPLT